MSELHVIGEIVGGRDFGGHSFFCVYDIVAGSAWTVVEGRDSGSTHIMKVGDDGIHWAHPLDVHFSFTSLQGWPKISVQVWQIDAYGRKDLAGYGMAYFPMPGAADEEIEIATWKPTFWHPSFLVRIWQNFRLFVMGGNPVLRDNALIHSNEERFKLHTIGGGIVTLRLNVLSRGLRQAGIVFS